MKENAFSVKTFSELKSMQLLKNVQIKHDTMEAALLFLQVLGEH